MRVHIGRFPKDASDRKISVKLHKWDSWNADHTIALIAHPLLIQLKEKKHGAPLVDDEDVPNELKSTSAPPKEHDYYVDANHFKRWDWVMDEMIFAMQEIARQDDGDSQFYDHSEVDESADVNTQVKQIKVDREGLEAYHKRIQNGCRLFGKYFTSLWD